MALRKRVVIVGMITGGTMHMTMQPRKQVVILIQTLIRTNLKCIQVFINMINEFQMPNYLLPAKEGDWECALERVRSVLIIAVHSLEGKMGAFRRSKYPS